MYKRLFEDLVRRNYKNIFFPDGHRNYQFHMPSYMFLPSHTEDIFISTLTVLSLKEIISLFEDLEIQRQEDPYV